MLREVIEGRIIGERPMERKRIKKHREEGKGERVGEVRGTGKYRERKGGREKERGIEREDKEEKWRE